MTTVAHTPGTELTVHRSTGLDVTAYEPRNLNQAVEMATVLAQSGLLGKLEPKPETVLFLMARGRELGFSTAQSIDAFHILDGKPSLTAQAQVALCKRRRDVCEYIVLVEGDTSKATWETKRVGDPSPVRITFTMQDAVRAELVKPGSGWKKYPDAMLRWRAATGLIRLVYPDLVLGLYDPEEMREMAEDRGARAVDTSITVLDHEAVEGTVIEAQFGDAPDEPEEAEEESAPALEALAANPTPVLEAGKDRAYQEGDRCPQANCRGKFKVAKGGENAGQLQCTGKIDGVWANHPAPAFTPPQPEPAAAPVSGVAPTSEQTERQKLVRACVLAWNAAPQEGDRNRLGIVAEYGRDPKETTAQFFARLSDEELIALTASFDLATPKPEPAPKAADEIDLDEIPFD